MQVLGPQSPWADLSKGCFLLPSSILIPSAWVPLTFTAGLGGAHLWASWRLPGLHLTSEEEEQLTSCRGALKWARRGGGEDQTQRGTCCRNPIGVTLAGGFTLLNLHLHP